MANEYFLSSFAPKKVKQNYSTELLKQREKTEYTVKVG
jgi:hypothetical protein